MRGLVIPLTLLAVVAVPGVAAAQRAEISIETDDVYAGAPFGLQVAVEGLAEAPEPTVAPFEIAGCAIDPLGVSPSVSSSITIVNGRRTESKNVSFVHRFRVTCAKPGTYRVPALSISQGGKKLATQPGNLVLKALATTPDMALRLGLPERPLTVGETFDVTIDWYLRKDPDGPSFSIPLFALDGFEVSAPAPTGRGRGVAFSIAGRDVELPYQRDSAELDGQPYTRFRFTAQVTPLASGRFELPAARVTARLPIGYGRDAFGFRVAQTNLFSADDRPRTIEVAPLPSEGRPASFAGAVGAGFSLEVAASHTVVKVGDPIELTITVRGAGHLSGLGLPDLSGPGGLPPADFDVPDGRPAGEMIDDGKAKRFAVTVRLQRAVEQIPPIELAYWNPDARTYAVARSQAIALSAGAATRVGAGDVVGGNERAGERDAVDHAVTAVGGDLSLSAPDRTLRRALTMARVRPVLLALYAVPTVLFGLSLALRRRRRVGGQLDAARAARVGLDALLARARTEPARELAGPLRGALRDVLRALDRPTREGDGLCDEIDRHAFDPRSADQPLPAELLTRVRDQLDRSSIRRGPGGPGGPGLALLAVVGLGLIGHAAWAAGDDPLAAARAAYQAAQTESDRAARTRAFAQVEDHLGALAAANPDCPELLTDWGNAALGAGDLGHAALAYRRALALAPRLERAQKNLAWVRAQQPAWAAGRDDAGAVDALLFWHRRLTRPEKHAWAAACFALAVVLVTPLGSSGGRRRRRAALVPAVVLVAMLGSIGFEPDGRADAVVVSDGLIVRAADSAGAPAAVAEPIPTGAEVTVLERRDGWHRVALSGGATGWLPSAGLASVVD